jgi:hypothetical protein
VRLVWTLVALSFATTVAAQPAAAPVRPADLVGSWQLTVGARDWWSSSM